MGNGASQFDMGHPTATLPRHSDLDPTLFAFDSLVFGSLVFAAEAFIILDRTKDAATEKAVPFRLEGSIIDRFWFAHLTI